MKIRGGLPNLISKLDKKDSIRVAYFGGSITAQEGWRVYSRQWLTAQYPKSNFVEINAAIGGCGSDFGVFRINEHVLQHNPDLVFVEFAVNDASTEAERISHSIEGIVRQIWKHNSNTDICFVYTIAESFVEAYRADSLPKSVQTMERLAQYYQIPAINYGPEVVKRLDQGTLIFKAKKTALDSIDIFSPDGVHPYTDSGHKIYAEVFNKAFLTIAINSSSQRLPHQAGKPLDPEYYAQATMINWDHFDGHEEWDEITIADDQRFEGFSKYFSNMGWGQPGDSITFNFEGDAVGFYDLRTPDSGVVLVEIDRVPRDTISRFDKYTTYKRISYKLITDLEDKRHHVTFRVLEEHQDKAGILSEMGNSMGNPKDYEGKNWYLAKVMINGKLFRLKK
ncbi:MAG: GDSL-type esterase/lipase family protein [Cyclobacteriaceae bacterium]